ncbi:MAG: DUF6410 domain-containing protein [Solirubrobacteraceae bacterium]
MSGNRDIGRIGTLARGVGGAALIALAVALYGIAWWDVAGALIACPLIAAGVAAVIRPVGAASAFAVLAIVIGLATALTFVTPVDQAAIWLFFGVSMLVAALRGYGGCEVLAIPNLLTGRRSALHCVIYTPIDAAEARWR